jgi:hypothetical protein
MKSARKPKRERIVGMVADARTLGVTRQHLSYVLHGHRPGRRLTAQYKALVSGRVA